MHPPFTWIRTTTRRCCRTSDPFSATSSTNKSNSFPSGVIGRIPAQAPASRTASTTPSCRATGSMLLLDPATERVAAEPGTWSSSRQPPPCLFRVSGLGAHQHPSSPRAARGCQEQPGREPAGHLLRQGPGVSMGICGLGLDEFGYRSQEAGHTAALTGVRWEQAWASSSSSPGLPGCFSEGLAPEVVLLEPRLWGYLSRLVRSVVSVVSPRR